MSSIIIVNQRVQLVAELQARIEDVIAEQGAHYQTIDVFCALANAAIKASLRARLPAESIERAFRDLVEQAFKRS